jgi:hypothetical protein
VWVSKSRRCKGAGEQRSEAVEYQRSGGNEAAKGRKTEGGEENGRDEGRNGDAKDHRKEKSKV